MVKISLYIGYPGCGKTTLAKNQIKIEPILEKVFGDKPYNLILIDDPTDFAEIEKHFVEGNHLFICDPHLCDPKNLEKATEKLNSLGECSIWSTFFEDDPIKCYNNVKYRNDGRLISLQSYKTYNYQIPDDYDIEDIIPIWQQEDATI